MDEVVVKMVRKVFKSGFLAVFLLFQPVFASGLYAATDVRIDGLFSDRALVSVDGQRKLLKVGETGPKGVRLLSSDSQQAVLEVDGRMVTLGVSGRISSSYSEAQSAEVRLLSGHNGHYMVGGFVNGRPVDFLVDTGASYISMNIHVARRLGVNFRNAPRTKMNTANGVTEAFEVLLDKVTIGAITQYKVKGVVHVGDSPHITLLGNSFLSNVELREEQGAMVMRQKF